MASKALLVRKPLVVPKKETETVDEMFAEVAQKAKHLFGYTAAAASITTAVATRQKNEVLREVAAIFRDLDIEPLDSKAVERYKRELREKLNNTADESTYFWTRREMKYHEDPIPTFALERAVAVAEALEDKNITYVMFVDALEEEDTNNTADPFLVLEVAGATLYLDVWDEPEFEGRRVK